MSKYEFKTVGTDEFELHYKDKVIPFKRTIDLAKKLQNIDAQSRWNMYEKLNQLGKSKKDLVIEKVIDGKIVIDETNYLEFERNFLNNERYILGTKIYEEVLGMRMEDLIMDIGLTNAQDGFIFSSKFRQIITGTVETNEKIPSIVENEQIPTENVEQL